MRRGPAIALALLAALAALAALLFPIAARPVAAPALPGAAAPAPPTPSPPRRCLPALTDPSPTAADRYALARRADLAGGTPPGFQNGDGPQMLHCF